ncbi:sensor histidine kinase [Ideonella sp. A 288]|uniref:sensor histidine kinase n=1 Tax=Ideonella sp. A 288 TaxID=1962181 RepID=UPI001185943F|nr:ATP-binding protein [Ideonella sp. A 288]
MRATDGVASWWQANAPADWMGWRLRALMALALAGCIGLFVVLRGISQAPHLDVTLRATGAQGIELVAAGQADLARWGDRRLATLTAGSSERLDANASMLQRTPRWIVDDGVRSRVAHLQDTLAGMMEAPLVRLEFSDGASLDLAPTPRGFAGLGTTFWLLSALSLLLYLVGAVFLLSRPTTGTLLYAAMAWCHSCSLLMIAMESLPGLGWPAGFAAVDLPLRTACDLFTGAAVLHVSLIHPHAVRHHRAVSGFGWALAAGFAAASASGGVPLAWWWTQALLIGFGIASWGALTWSHRRWPHPVSLVLRRLCVAGTGTLGLLTVAIALADRQGQSQQLIASIGSVIWYVFFASLLLLVPFLARSQHVMREFAMLAGLSTVATSLDLLFITVFALGQFASLALALFVSLGLYAAARQWMLNHLSGTGVATAERTFESLYRAARALEATPNQSTEHVARLLQELFDPLEVRSERQSVAGSQVSAHGSTLTVPMPRMPGMAAGDDMVLLLRYARRGRRMFTREDARLTDRVLQQLRSAVAYDRAVELGRSEERMRLAQDLHDDIGARLLTLMYKAPDAEMEEYVRHTLQDLKTLTRGLATVDHPLSHAAAEWKADIAQRLAASRSDLDWSFNADHDVLLTVVQWSGLTRILRELVNNVIAHAGATRVEIDITYEGGELLLRIADDGGGRQPQAWSHGLGLGGVRKRAKLLGGRVQWLEREPQGIVCEVRVPRLNDPMRTG